jgi:muramoyltetrapeptide carboxypeptidase
VLIPPALKPRDRIRVVAPSGRFDRALVLRAIGWLGGRYRVIFDWEAFSAAGMFAGSDERRLDELNQALRDPLARAIVVARGGHGLARIVHRADIAAVHQHPKWVAGFSDVTLLHAELTRAGIASMHAPNATGLGRGDAATRQQYVDALEQPLRSRCFSGLRAWSPGTAQGPLVGGNLTMLFTWAAAGRLKLPRGCVLLLEDVTEVAYRLDRMLTALLLSGALDDVAGVVTGEFVDCPSGPHGVPTDDVLCERLSRLGVPVLTGLAVGHGPVNHAVPLGVPARLDGTRGTLTLGGPPAES